MVSDSYDGYMVYSFINDCGVIMFMVALFFIVYILEESFVVLYYFYYDLGDCFWGEYGFYDVFYFGENWVVDFYLVIDQGFIICMMENYWIGLLWELFMFVLEVQQGLDVLDFIY